MFFSSVDNVFGCHLATLCSQERTTVPSFVEKCIKAVENRGNPPSRAEHIEVFLVALCRIKSDFLVLYRFGHRRTLQSEREPRRHPETTLQGRSR